MGGNVRLREGGGGHSNLKELGEAAGDEGDGLQGEGLPGAKIADVPPKVGLLAIAAVEFEFGAKVNGWVRAREVFSKRENGVDVAVVLELFWDDRRSALGDVDRWWNEGGCAGLMRWCIGRGAVCG